MSAMVLVSALALALGVGLGAYFGGRASHNGDWSLIVIVSVLVVASVLGMGYELLFLHRFRESSFPI